MDQLPDSFQQATWTIEPFLSFTVGRADNTGAEQCPIEIVSLAIVDDRVLSIAFHLTVLFSEISGILQSMKLLMIRTWYC